jgi:transcriptional/translational regulatory protein YebC/TACO1
VIRYPSATASADDMLEAAIEAGAENAESNDEGHEVTCPIEDFFTVRDALETRFGPPETARLEWRPTTFVTLDEERAASVLKLLDALDENDDVQNVYANFDIPDEVAAKLSG